MIYVVSGQINGRQDSVIIKSVTVLHVRIDKEEFLMKLWYSDQIDISKEGKSDNIILK